MVGRLGDSLEFSYHCQIGYAGLLGHPRAHRRSFACDLSEDSCWMRRWTTSPWISAAPGEAMAGVLPSSWPALSVGAVEPTLPEVVHTRIPLEVPCAQTLLTLCYPAGIVVYVFPILMVRLMVSKLESELGLAVGLTVGLVLAM